MNIFFASNLIAYLCLIDFRLLLRHRWARTLLRQFDRLAARVRFLPLAIIVALLTILYVLAGEPSWGLAVPLVAAASCLVLLVGLWGIYRQILHYAGCLSSVTPKVR